jgi:hypothetical protein
MKSKFELEKYEILDAGTVMQFSQDTPITITITEDDDTNISIRFEFVNKIDVEIDNLHLSSFDANTLKVTCTYKFGLSNFGASIPLKIGTFNGRELYFNFRLSLNDSTDPAIIYYTWYIERGVKL